MDMPDFVDAVPRLRVIDPLAALFGCPDDGVLEYGYADAIRLTGHSCPTVAAAYWLTWRALHLLYPDELPQRGGVRIEFRDDLHSSSRGVVATVMQMLTGAAGRSGFKGLHGHFSRAGLARFAPSLPLSLRFTRLDNGQALDAAAELGLLPLEQDLAALLELCLRGRASADVRREFGRRWQARVRHLLLDRAYDDGMFVLRPVAARRAERGSPYASRAGRTSHALPP